MDWTWLPTVTLFTFESPLLPGCTHTRAETNIHGSLRRPPPAEKGEEVVRLIRLSSPPGDGSHPQGSGGVRPISPSTPHTSTQGWRDQLCLCVCVCVCVCRNVFTCVHFIISSVCAHTHTHTQARLVCVAVWRSGRSTSDFPHKTSSVNLIRTQPADGPFQIDKNAFEFFARGCSPQWLSLSLSHTHTHMQTHPPTQYSPLWSSNVCRWLQYFFIFFFPVSCSFSEPNLKAAAIPRREEWISLGLLWH